MVGGTVVTHTEHGSGTTKQITHLHKDAQSSTVVITGQAVSGNVLKQQIAYDPWGKQATLWSHSQFVFGLRLGEMRGYTGHTMVNDFDLIHMGGRTYNPVLGRFMQADPFIQEGANLQNYNRYSYVLNNPMSYTDPSGYLFNRLKDISRGFIKILGSRLSQVMVTMASAGCGWMAPACLAVGTYQVQRAHGASSTGALRTSVIAGFMSQITPAAGAAGESTRSHLERLGDELMNRAYQRAMEGVMRATQGGTSAHATSGKFANGASAGAFARVLEQVSEGQASGRQREPTTDLRDHVIANRRARLSVSDDGTTISGTVHYYCSLRIECAPMVEQMLTYINVQVDGLTVDIQMVEVKNIFRADVRFRQQHYAQTFEAEHLPRLLWDSISFNDRYPSVVYSADLWAHEFGHFLGFGHKFSYSDSAPHSVMSYSSEPRPLQSNEVQRLIVSVTEATPIQP
ncbi:RHS repeat-associated core domain-containing protein [Aliidiomarina sanyensis]|nr:RHS repeat-associated core domain-containing protein [Aliidiomarina sanyensis]